MVNRLPLARHRTAHNFAVEVFYVALGFVDNVVQVPRVPLRFLKLRR